MLGRGSVGYSLTSTRPGQAEQQPHTWVEVRHSGGGHLPAVLRCSCPAGATNATGCCDRVAIQLPINGVMMLCAFPTQSGAGQMDGLPLMTADRDTRDTHESGSKWEFLTTPVTHPPHVHRPARRPSRTPWTMPPAWALAATLLTLGRGGSRWLLVCGPWASAASSTGWWRSTKTTRSSAQVCSEREGSS